MLVVSDTYTDATMPDRESILKTSKGQIAVATTVMLTFISFWRAAAIVLNDMGSSAYYVPAIAEQAIGKSAPWFVLGIMLFSYAVRLVYTESTILFTRGGLYTVVKSTLGGTLAKLSVSALMFDFILTGPISSVSAGHYIMYLFNQVLTHFGQPVLPQNVGAILLACGIIAFFWWENIKGIEESSSKALRIMMVTSLMVVVLIAWSLYTLLQMEWSLPPTEIHLHEHALGWLKDFSFPHTIPAVAIAIGLGHSLLAMSGEETFAQVSREVAHPKVKNLKRVGFIIFIFSLVFTFGVSFFATVIMPDSARPQYFENLIMGLVAYLSGPTYLKMFFQGFVVLVGFLMLAGACNTAIIGSNSVLNRLAEDGVLPNWFRKPHHRFGTSHRILNTIALLQIVTILLSRGDVYLLGEAYAFGVLWSFVFQTLSVTVLRFKNRAPREWKVPFNLHLGKVEIPLGLFAILFLLLAMALANLFTKQVSTISGVAFSLFLFAVFTFSEKWGKRKATGPVGLDPFQLVAEPQITRATVGTKPHGILVPIIESKDLSHLNAVLEETDTKTRDVIVFTVRLLKGPTMGQQEEEIFTDQEQDLFTRAVKLAEKHGKHIRLVVAASNDTFFSIAQTAFKLDCENIILRVSAKMTPLQQAKALSEAWDKLPNTSKRDILIRIWRDGKYVLDWTALPPLPDIPREALRSINFLYRELNPDEREEISRSAIIELAINKLLKEYQSGQFTWDKKASSEPPKNERET